MDINWRKIFSDLYSDAGSFHPSLWEEERRAKQRIHFDFDDEETDEVNISVEHIRNSWFIQCTESICLYRDSPPKRFYRENLKGSQPHIRKKWNTEYNTWGTWRLNS